MALKQIVPILITLVGDGSSTVFTYALQNMYQGGVGGSIPYGSGVAVPPSSIVINNPPVAITSSTVDANGNITITFTTAPANGAQYTLEVDLYFTSGGATSSSATQTQNVTIVGTSTVTVSGTVAVTQSTSPWVVNATQWNSVALGSPSNYGTSPGAVSVIGVNAFVTNTVTVSGTVTANAGTGNFATNLAQYNGASLTGTVTAYGTAPTGNVFGVNAFVTNTVTTTVSGTVAVTQSGTWTDRIVGNTGATLDAALTAGTAPTNGVGVLQQYNTTQVAPTNGQTFSLQADQSGNQLSFPGVQSKAGAVWNSGTSGGTLQYPTGTSTVGAPTGAPAVVVQLDQSAGTFTGGAVTFQGTYDGSNWVSIPVGQLLNPQSFAQLTNPYTFTTSTNIAYLIQMQGFQQVRLNLSSAITGTGTVTPNWAVLSYPIVTPSASASSVNVSQWGGTAITAATGYGTAPTGNVGAVNAFITNTVTVSGTVTANAGTGEFAVNVNQVNGATLSVTNPLFTNLSDGTSNLTNAAITTWGTAATGKVLGVNAELFVGNNAVSATAPVPVSATAAANASGNPIFTQSVTGSTTVVTGVVQVSPTGAANAVGNPFFVLLSDGTNNLTNSAITTWGTAPTGKVLGVNAELFVGTSAVSASAPVPISATAAANTKLNPVFTAITDGTNVITAAISAYGSAPTGTEVMGVNAFVTNTVTVSGTVTANQGGAPWTINLTQVAGTALGATAVTNFGTAPAAAAVPGVNASLFTGTTGVAAATFGTTNTGNGILTNASLFVGTTVAVAASAGVQKVGISGATGVTLDAAQAATAPANAISVSGTFNNATGTTGALSAGQASALQLDSHGLALVDIASANGAAMSASNGVLASVVQGGNTAAVKAASTAAVAADQALVVAISPNTPIAVGQAGTSNTSSASWTSATSNNTAVTLVSATFAYDTVVVTFNQTTTITGGAANFEVSNDNSNWVLISGINPAGGSAVSSYAFQASTYISFVFNTSGWQYFRVRLSPAITGSGTVTVGFSAQATATGPLQVRDGKDTGRTFLVWFCDAIATVTSEALISIAVNKAGSGLAAATTYTVTTGKTLRLQTLSASVAESSSTVQYVKVRVRSGASVTTSSQVCAGLFVASSGATNNAGYAEQCIPDGLEIAGGQQVGISMVSGTVNGLATITLIGYEY